jgi:rubredoxin
MEALTVFCPECGSSKLFKSGLRYLENNVSIQRFKCRKCSYRFSKNANKDGLGNSYRQLCASNRKSKKLDSTQEIKTCVGDGKANLIDYAWRQKKRGIQDNTITVRSYILSQLVKKGCDLFNPDSVETYLATENMTKAKKRNYVAAYHSFTKVFKISWEPIKVHYEPKQPFVPTHEELNALIHASGKRLATFLQVALDTGGRIGEICRYNGQT